MTNDELYRIESLKKENGSRRMVEVKALLEELYEDYEKENKLTEIQQVVKELHLKWCDEMRNELRALECIKHRTIYDIEHDDLTFVNKLIYWGDELMIMGYVNNYKVSDYGVTWKPVSEVKDRDFTHIFGCKDKELEKVVLEIINERERGVR